MPPLYSLEYIMSAGKKFNYGELIVPGLSALFALSYFIQTSDAPFVAMQWPYMVAILFAVLWCAVFIIFIIKRSSAEEEKKISIDKRQLVIFAAPVIYIFAMNYLGFAISSFIFLAILFRILGSKSWVRNILVAFIFAAVLYTALVVLMQMSFPELGLSIGSITL